MSKQKPDIYVTSPLSLQKILIDTSPSYRLTKEDIIYAELEACERLLKNEVEKRDKDTVESEIRELKIALDL